MKKQYVKIRCRGGLSRSVKVKFGGRKLDGVTEINILPIKPGGLVMAQLTMIVDLDLEAELGSKTPKESETVLYGTESKCAVCDERNGVHRTTCPHYKG